jgi:hypothetical protein
MLKPQGNKGSILLRLVYLYSKIEGSGDDSLSSHAMLNMIYDQ